MSEFRIVKCKKCDAGLTEIVGESLTRCVQCGHNFNVASKTKKRAYNVSQVKKPASEVAHLVNKLRQIKKSKTAKSAKTPATKKKSNPVITIIVWIVVFNIVRSIFFN